MVGFPSLMSTAQMCVWQYEEEPKDRLCNAAQVNTGHVATQPEGGTSCTPAFQDMLCAGCLLCMREHVHTTTLGVWSHMNTGLSRQ